MIHWSSQTYSEDTFISTILSKYEKVLLSELNKFLLLKSQSQNNCDKSIMTERIYDWLNSKNEHICSPGDWPGEA